MSESIESFSLSAIGKKFREGSLKAVALTQHCIDQHEPSLNAYREWPRNRLSGKRSKQIRHLPMRKMLALFREFRFPSKIFMASTTRRLLLALQHRCRHPGNLKEK